MQTDYPLIFSPLTIRGITFRNRIMHAPMVPGSRTTRTMSIALLERIGAGLTELDETRVVRIGADAVECRRNGETILVEADLVIWAVGLKPRRAEAEQFRVVPEFRMIGDCCRSGKIGDAVHSGFDAAYAL